MDTKVCTKCGESKAVDKFSKQSSNKDGRAYHCKDCRAAYNKTWFKLNPTDKAVQSARSKKWEADNKDKKRQYVEANRERRVEYEQNRRARLASIPNDMPKDYWNILLAFYGGVCAKCGTDKDLEHDHVIPITWEGCTHSLRNSQILCTKDNSSKKNYSDDDYRDWSNGILSFRHVS